MGRVYVSNLESGTLARQSAGSKRRYTALMGHFRERIVLIHKLRKLAGAEKFLHGGRHRFGIDHFLRHQAFGLCLRQALLDGSLYTHESHTERVFGHFTNASYTSVAEVVDIIDRTVAITDIDERSEHVQNIVVLEYATAFGCVSADTTVELHSTNGGQIVAVRIEEQVLKQVLCRFLGRRLAGTHHSVNLDESLQSRGRWIDFQGVGYVRTAIEVIHIQGSYVLDAFLNKNLGQLGCQFVVRSSQQLAGFRIDDVMRKHLAFEILGRYDQIVDSRLFHIADMLGRDTAAFFDDKLSAQLDVKHGGLAPQALRNEAHANIFL